MITQDLKNQYIGIVSAMHGNIFPTKVYATELEEIRRNLIARNGLP